jgi:hypothetical protein
VASIAAGPDGLLYNVNAETLAADLAARIGVKRLVIAGGTAGVLDESGKTLPDLDEKDIERLIASGVASAGMVAKLGACRDALAGGVDDVLLSTGRMPPPRRAIAVSCPWSSRPRACAHQSQMYVGPSFSSRKSEYVGPSFSSGASEN